MAHQKFTREYYASYVRHIKGRLDEVFLVLAKTRLI